MPNGTPTHGAESLGSFPQRNGKRDSFGENTVIVRNAALIVRVPPKAR